MSANLKLTHEAIGVEVRRGTFDVVVDSGCVEAPEMSDTIGIPIECGHHTGQLRNGRPEFGLAEPMPLHRISKERTR
jgi:hypothetical protein